MGWFDKFPAVNGPKTIQFRLSNRPLAREKIRSHPNTTADLGI
jgi:hypothetical protein